MLGKALLLTGGVSATAAATVAVTNPDVINFNPVATDGQTSGIALDADTGNVGTPFDQSDDAFSADPQGAVVAQVGDPVRVPEPLTVMGGLAVLGFGAAMKRKLSSSS
ncbi:MAG: PEP-CTERM sorting domain-containing protein [Cyanobacteria bacterium J06635_1]